jgi:hypothetical protein
MILHETYYRENFSILSGPKELEGGIVCTVGCKKNGSCQNKIDTFLQFYHSVKPSYER